MTIKIVDSHFHFYDRKINNHPFLANYDEKLALLWGKNYHHRLGESYLPADYLQDMQGFEIEHLVMAELVSTDPLKEMQFAQELARQTNYPSAAIANISLLDKNLAKRLDEYLEIPIVRAVRDHLLWDPNNPQHCYTERGDTLKEPMVEESFTILKDYPYSFEFEIYSQEIPLVRHYAEKFPTINFALHCLGWPIDQSPSGFEKWKKEVQDLSQCPNVFVKITAIECIFGLQWSLEQITPWIKATIERFGASRCMFGSHLPISKLSKGVSALYEAYLAIVADLSIQEQQDLFANSAKRFYRV
ncbi:putative metal-dependent hydrolase of the TIM-barrel fold protein [Legionella massiliensis]|uniref:Putative metal-dependent hydrolase of the TIM-barrel fold protein n=1 Tax=Legionella massiliensis TaxID=1034943 RepID=A0A078KVU6_9GAMM|nr:amidohydrolase family protein [Legionella massiliensis]CDZ77116.1 putative metal-dependent hydrolase of the TIM-barrel fold protein [Legionella massiliensis]CEE12854.1 Amidohydrolase [Legionella massiliensis]